MMSNYYDDMKNLIRCAMAVVAGLAISGMLAVAPVNAESGVPVGDLDTRLLCRSSRLDSREKTPKFPKDLCQQNPSWMSFG